MRKQGSNGEPVLVLPSRSGPAGGDAAKRNDKDTDGGTALNPEDFLEDGAVNDPGGEGAIDQLTDMSARGWLSRAAFLLRRETPVWPRIRDHCPYDSDKVVPHSAGVAPSKTIPRLSPALLRQIVPGRPC